MPYLEKNEMPKRPEPQKKQEAPKKPESKDGWLGKSRYEIDRYLKSAKGRSEISKEIGLPSGNYSKQNEEIKDIESMIPGGLGSAVDKNEKGSLNYRLSQDKLRDMRKPLEGPDWQKESRERKFSQKEREFLKKKFGIK